MAGDDDIWDMIPDSAPVKFESAEHDSLGASCTLRWPDEQTGVGNDPRFPLKRVRLQNPRGWGYEDDLLFSNVIPLAGDFYTTRDAWPISYGTAGDSEDAGEARVTRKGRFRQAVDDLASDYQQALQPCLGLLRADIHTMEETEDGHHHASQVYHDGKLDDKNKIASGKDWSLALSYNVTKYATIAAWNMDHFGMWAQDAYTAGHSVALDRAEAGTPFKADGTTPRTPCERLNALQDAYLAEAFAMHYLTDLFSAGHLRVPRREMHTSKFMGLLVAGLGQKASDWADMEKLGITADVYDGQTNYMHDNDGTCGIRARNYEGEEWIQYGDKQFFSPYNRVNRLRSVQATQAGVDEVYDVWRGAKKKPETVYARDGKPDKLYRALRLSPAPSEYLQETTDDGPWTGNPARLWLTTIKNQDTPFGEENLADPIHYRRIDVNDHDNFVFYKANPGWSPDTGKYMAGVGSDDVLGVTQKSFIKKAEFFPPVPPVEAITGGFVQIAEFIDRSDRAKLQHAVNVWGPARFKVPGEQDDEERHTSLLRKRYPEIEYPINAGRIVDDQKTLHWTTWRKVEDTTYALRFYHRDSAKAVHADAYMFKHSTSQKAQLLTDMSLGAPGIDSLTLNSNYPSGRTVFSSQDGTSEVRRVECSSMRFFCMTNQGEPECAGFRVVEPRDPNDASKPLLGQDGKPVLKYQLSILQQKPEVKNLLYTDEEAGLTYPDVVKSYEPFDTSDNRLLALRRLSGYGSAELDIEVRSYKRSMVGATRQADELYHFGNRDFQIMQTGPLQAMDPLQKFKITLKAASSPPIQDAAGWQVLVSDFRNIGRPELIFLIGRGALEYDVQVFGFVDGVLKETAFSSGKPVPAALPDPYATKQLLFKQHQFTATCPSETYPLAEDILMVSRVSETKEDVTNYHLSFRTWIKGKPPQDTPQPADWADNPEKVEFGRQKHNTTIMKDTNVFLPASAAAVGWASVVEGKVQDDLCKVAQYFSIKWMRCRVLVPTKPGEHGVHDPKFATTRGIMEVFSYFGVLGMRVFAPQKKGQYDAWALVGQTPFMGQTSRGTGLTTTGNWNAASIHPWGQSLDFGDINTWNRADRSDAEKDNLTGSWADVRRDAARLRHGWDFEGARPGPFKPASAVTGILGQAGG